MKRFYVLRLALLAGLLLSLAGLAGAAAAPQDGYSLLRFSAQGGVHICNEGNDYQLCGTLGQYEDDQVSGEAYTLGGGVWPGGSDSTPDHVVYLPMVRR
ncbi:MAG: hypothetical protein JXA78_18505 [Anaerolineales bacterium]|nr:hypothetical protein [Anaerolineales bacterium]